MTTTTVAPAAGLSLKTIGLIILGLAILVSGYLSYVKATDVAMVCVDSATFDCGKVQNSAYSEMFGVPIAWLGLTTNLILVALILLEDRVALLQDYGLLITFGLVLFAFLFSVYLVYVQAALLKTYCPWCLVHEVLIFALFGVTSLRVYRLFQE